MTLQQAHELQRRELMSLRAEVARLQKQTTGLFPVEEKEALERHIRHLEQVNKAEARRHEEARTHWKRVEALKFELEIENLELKEKLESVLAENKLLSQRAEKAEAEVAMLNGMNPRFQRKNSILISRIPRFLRPLFPSARKFLTAENPPVENPGPSRAIKPILPLG